MIMFVSAAAGVVIGALIGHFAKSAKRAEGGIVGGIAGLVVGFITLIVGGATVIDSQSAWDVTPELRSVKELVAAKDGISINGSFFIGSGSIGGNPGYYFYEKQDDGGMSLKRVYANEARVYEEERNSGAIERWTSKKTIKSQLVAKLFFMGKPRYTRSFYKFRVPKGSIRTTFVFDAE